MRIYIAAKYGKRFELRELAQKLRDMGHEITAQWLDNAEESKSREDAAKMDVDDVLRADTLIFFAEPRHSLNTGGGRYFELGLAWAEGKRILAVSESPDYETVFLHLPGISVFSSIEVMLDFMS